jgi:hypothetical protein
VDDNINYDIDDKIGDVENVLKFDYNEETLEDVVDGNVIKLLKLLKLMTWILMPAKLHLKISSILNCQRNTQTC